jgi:DNA ligase (NAD+)
MTVEQLTALDTIGPNMAASVTLYFQQEKNRELINRLRAAGVNCSGDKDQESEASRPLTGKTYVLTGSLEEFTRDQAQEYIEKLGGKVSSSVSKKTAAVIAGKEPGSKFNKAQQLGIDIIDEAAFLKMLRDYTINL